MKTKYNTARADPSHHTSSQATLPTTLKKQSPDSDNHLHEIDSQANMLSEMELMKREIENLKGLKHILE